MTPKQGAEWLRLGARAVITITFLAVGIWLILGEQPEWGSSFLTFVAGYWLK